MNLSEQRQIAIRAARSQVRRQGIEPAELPASEALKVLDDLARFEPELVASRWYSEASDNQIKLFKREWE